MKAIFVVSFFLLFLLNDILGSSFSKKKCEEYRKSSTSGTIAAIPENRLGLETLPELYYQFMARVVLKDGRRFNGILISENYVLTTASASQHSPVHYVLLGNETNNEQQQRYTVVNQTINANFTTLGAGANIQLLQLNRKVKPNKKIRPACLSTLPIMIGEYIEIGWNHPNSSQFAQLHQTNFDVALNETCRDEFINLQYNETYVQGLDGRQLFCATTDSTEKNPEICKYGYGVMLRKNRTHSPDEVVGLSISNECTRGNPEVFVGILPHLDWIETNVWHTTPISTTPTPKPNSGTTLCYLKNVFILMALLSVLL